MEVSHCDIKTVVNYAGRYHEIRWNVGFLDGWNYPQATGTAPSVQPLNIRGVDHPTALRATAERLDACWRAIDNAALGGDDATTLVAFDHLGDQDMAPRTQPWPSALARLHGVAKGLPNGPDVRHQAIGTDNKGTTGRTAPPPRDQPSNQGQVPLLTDLATQPQARLDHHGQRHPHDATLFLDAQLIGLYPSPVAVLF